MAGHTKLLWGQRFLKGEITGSHLKADVSGAMWSSSRNNSALHRIFKAHNLGLLQNSWNQYFRIPIYWQSSVEFISHMQKVINFSSEKYPEFTLSCLFLVELWWFGFHTSQEVFKFEALLQQTKSSHTWQYFCLYFALGKHSLPSCPW